MKKTAVFRGMFINLLLATASLPDIAVAQDSADDDLWVFQDWCLTHVGCGKFGLKHKTDR
jgi:hypothetical protein